MLPALAASAPPTINPASNLVASGVSATTPRVVSLALGMSHSCALINTGEVRCWGQFAGKARHDGQMENLGDNETPASGEPVALGGRAVQISAGGDNTCARLDTGAVRCWHFRQIWGSQPSQINPNWRKPPVSEPLVDIDIRGKAVQISVGTEHVCALLQSGSIRCLKVGEFGNRRKNPSGPIQRPAATEDMAVGSQVSQVAAGHHHTCVLLGSSKVRCWGAVSGDEFRGQDKSAEALPASTAPIIDVGGRVTQLASGGSICALLAQHTVRCWGDNSLGQLGYGHKKRATDPAIAGDIKIAGKVIQITVGLRHACALLETGRVHCWGYNREGELGYGNRITIGDYDTPENEGDVIVGGKVVQIAAGGFHTCALLQTGRVRCWGAGDFGQLGYGNTESIGDSETPSEAGDVQLLPGEPEGNPISRQHQSESQGASESGRIAPFVWEKRGWLQQPDLQPCEPDCTGCKTLSDPARFGQRKRNTIHRGLTASERANLHQAYVRYLSSPGCTGIDGRPQMDPAVIGTAQDLGRTIDVLDGSFTQKGAKQTIVLFFAGLCGRVRNDVPDPGQRLLVLMEGGQLLSTNVEVFGDRLAAIDLEEDGISEVILSASDTTMAWGDQYSIILYSYASGHPRRIAAFQTDSNSCRNPNCGAHWETSVLYRYNPNENSLCFETKARQRNCPGTRRHTTNTGCGL